MHSKGYAPRKAKTTYNLEQREYILMFSDAFVVHFPWLVFFVSYNLLFLCLHFLLEGAHAELPQILLNFCVRPSSFGLLFPDIHVIDSLQLHVY